MAGNGDGRLFPHGSRSSNDFPCVNKTPLVDQIGGPEAMASVLVPAVEIFYCKLLADERINKFFVGIDTERLKNKQVEFMAYVFGSPARYTGKDIAQAHQRLIDEKGLNETHFDIVIDHFIATMKELNVADAVTEQAVEILQTSRPVFERRPSEADSFSMAMRVLKEYKHAKSRSLQDVKGKLEEMGVTDSGQLQLLRSAVRMRGEIGVGEDMDACLSELIGERGKVERER